MPPKVKFKKESVVKAAFDIVRKNGWQGLSARSIANKLNSSTGPIYSQLKSMKTIEEKVVKKAMELFEQFIIKPRTGDKWLDHGLGYVLFARDEKHLFKAIFDENHIMVQKKYSPKLWTKLGQELSDYSLFKGLPEKIQTRIRHRRWIFIHGIASLITNSYEFDYIQSDKELTILIQRTSMALYRGYKS